MTHLDLVISNLTRHQGRFVLTSVAVFLTFLLLNVVLTLGLSLNAPQPGSERLVVAGRAGLFQALPYAYRNEIAAYEAVAAVSPVTLFAGRERTGAPPMVALGVDPKLWFEINPGIAVEAGVRTSFQEERAGLLVGRDLLKRSGWLIGQTVSLDSPNLPRLDRDHWRFVVSGVFDDAASPGGSTYALAHFDYLNETRSFQRDTASWFSLSLTPGAEAGTVAATIDARTTNTLAQTRTQSEAELSAAFLKQFTEVVSVTLVVIGCGLLSTMIIIGSVISMGVRQRMAELSTLRAIGFSRRRIVLLIIAEGVGLTLFGAVSGLLCAAVLMRAMSGAISQVAPGAGVSMLPAAICLLMAVALGVSSAVAPALRSLGATPAQAFREAFR